MNGYGGYILNLETLLFNHEFLIEELNLTLNIALSNGFVNIVSSRKLSVLIMYQYLYFRDEMTGKKG